MRYGQEWRCAARRVARAPNKGFARRQQEFMGQEVGGKYGGMEV